MHLINSKENYNSLIDLGVNKNYVWYLAYLGMHIADATSHTTFNTSVTVCQVLNLPEVLKYYCHVKFEVSRVTYNTKPYNRYQFSCTHSHWACKTHRHASNYIHVNSDWIGYVPVQCFTVLIKLNINQLNYNTPMTHHLLHRVSDQYGPLSSI